MRHPAQGIRPMTSVVKRFVESNCIRSNIFFFRLDFFRELSVDVFRGSHVQSGVRHSSHDLRCKAICRKEFYAKRSFRFPARLL